MKKTKILTATLLVAIIGLITVAADHIDAPAVSGTKADEKFAAGTEAGLFEEVGLPVIVMGPGNMAQAHTPDEFIEIAQLAGCMEQLRSFV